MTQTDNLTLCRKNTIAIVQPAIPFQDKYLKFPSVFESASNNTHHVSTMSVSALEILYFQVIYIWNNITTNTSLMTNLRLLEYHWGFIQLKGRKAILMCYSMSCSGIDPWHQITGFCLSVCLFIYLSTSFFSHSLYIHI